MKATDLIPFDPAIVPWETHINDWALCLIKKPEGRVWVEHKLICSVLGVDQSKNTDTILIQMVLIEIGGKVASVFPLLDLSNCPVVDIKFSNIPVTMSVANFFSEKFVFLPRHELKELVF